MRLPFFIKLMAAALLASSASTSAMAKDVWPQKPVTLVVPYAPGGGTDIIARLIGAKLSEIWGQNVIVENKSGANGIIGSNDIARSRPDGYKIMLVVGSHIINPVLTKSMPFNTDEDFTPITRLAVSPLVLVVPAEGKFKDLDTFLKLAKDDTTAIGYSEGQTQLTVELIRQATGAKISSIPYRGGSPLMVDIIGGHVASGVTSVLTSLPHVQSGKLKVIGIADKNRLSVFPDAKTFTEAGFDAVESLSWYGLFGPKGMPEDVVAQINTSLLTATQDPTIAKQLADQGATVVLDTPAQFQDYLNKEKQKWTKVAQQGGIEAQ